MVPGTNQRASFLFAVTSVEKFRFFTAANYPSLNARVVGFIEIKLTIFGASSIASFTDEIFVLVISDYYSCEYMFQIYTLN
jgi:hypothetical protein